MSGPSWNYRMDKGGVCAILKSSAVKSELNRVAAQKAEEANTRMHTNMPSTAGHDGYMAGKAKGLTYTAVASVYTASKAAANDQEHHQTLNAINH